MGPWGCGEGCECSPARPVENGQYRVFESEQRPALIGADVTISDRDIKIAYTRDGSEERVASYVINRRGD